MQTMTKDSDLSPDDIIAWLRKHPDFFNKNPDILEHLTPPKAVTGKQPKKGGVADFQFYMVQRLKADRDDVLESAKEIIETSRINMNNQTRYHQAVTRLLDARTFEEFISTITLDFASILDVDIVSVLVESDSGAIPHTAITGIRLVTPGSIDHLMRGKAIILEPFLMPVDTSEAIYGGGATLVKSHALLRLETAKHMAPTVIAFGSRDPSLFEGGQGTELLNFLGDVIAKMIHLWLNLERGQGIGA